MGLQKINILLILLLANTIVFANNLHITNLQIASVNTSQEYANVEFDISWENSWRDSLNWDAVWVFMKFRIIGSTNPWEHVTLDTSGHTLPAGATLFTPSDGKGIFLYRSANGYGNSNFINVQLRWNYGLDGVTSTDSLDIKIFGIEMVYVPQGSFYAGDGQTDSTEVYGNFEAGSTGTSFQITSEGTLTLGGGSAGSLGNNSRANQFAFGGSCGGCLNGSGDDFDDANSQTLPAAFPKGFNAFYCMKYEMTQQQFVDMLNCLTIAQQTTYLTQTGTFFYTGTLPDNRYDITQSGSSYLTANPYVPMIFYDWIKAAAYADWAALRPMTELEFEKACRGFDVPVTNEYAWGNANVDLTDNLILNNAGLDIEGISSGYDSSGTQGNSWMRTGNQTMANVARVGIFAAHPSNIGRISGGSSVWGIMELSGNAWERAVSVGHSEGRKFTGLHGDGYLDTSGYANVVDWPGTFAISTVESNIGVGYRGGALAYPTPNLDRNARVSNRRLASGYWDTVINDDGARFARKAN